MQMAQTQGSRPRQSTRHVVVTFGRDATEEDLQRLRAIGDVIAVREAIDIDSDHVHGLERE
jgi:hypothetical protein